MKNEILIGTLVTLTRWRCTTTQGDSENKQEICTKLDLPCVYKRLQGFQALSNLGLRTSKLSQGIQIADNQRPRHSSSQPIRFCPNRSWHEKHTGWSLDCDAVMLFEFVWWVAGILGHRPVGNISPILRTLFLKSRCNSMDKTTVKSTLSIKWTCQLDSPLSLSGTHDIGLGSVSSKFFNKVLRLTRNKRILISLKFRSTKYACFVPC